jgi:hypothetical protein
MQKPVIENDSEPVPCTSDTDILSTIHLILSSHLGRPSEFLQEISSPKLDVHSFHPLS